MTSQLKSRGATTPDSHRQLFILLLSCGLVAPPLVYLTVEAVAGERSLWRSMIELPSLLFKRGYSLGTAFLFGSVPLVVLAFFVRSCLRDGALLGRQGRMARLSGIAGAILLCAVITLGIQIEVWRGVYQLSPGSSTNAVAIYFLPAYGGVAMAVGYAVGWLIGRWVLPGRDPES